MILMDSLNGDSQSWWGRHERNGFVCGSRRVVARPVCLSRKQKVWVRSRELGLEAGLAYKPQDLSLLAVSASSVPHPKGSLPLKTALMAGTGAKGFKYLRASCGHLPWET